MSTVNAYLTFEGNCEKAFNFYKSVFGGEFTYIGKFKDMPSDKPLSAEDQEKIMHVSLPIGSTILMGSDSAGEWGGSTIMGTNISLSINTDSKEEADRLFNGLSAGGRATMPMNKTFWGAYFGMFTDQFGINWMVNFDETPQP